MQRHEIIQFIENLNNEYLKVHNDREELFWAVYMGLSEDKEAFGAADGKFLDFRQSKERLDKVREVLDAATKLGEDDLVTTLKGWEQFFASNVVEDPKVQELSKEISRLEQDLDSKRKKMDLGYTDPHSGKFVPASSVALALKVSTHDDEATRKAAWEGLCSIEGFALENGFIENVKARNAFAKGLGYQDFYDYKVQSTEHMSKDELFAYLTELDERTRDAGKVIVDSLDEKDRTPWNFKKAIGGDAIRLLDPYLQFGDAVRLWGKSFAGMGVQFDDAELQLDLVDRKGKHENGFCHAPIPTFRHFDGNRVAGKVNFTSNAVPGQEGSGNNALKTLFHEGGHAAHFANVDMHAPCFSQEFSPTSAAMAETQSMFFDALIEDADWLRRYANVPWDVIETATRQNQLKKVLLIRSLLLICFAEKALYEMSDDELTPENIMNTFIDIERRFFFIDRCPRPTLAVPHLLSSDSSAIYHGYMLALCAVAQTRDYFYKRDGYIVDNPKVGPDMREAYWKLGNALPFAEFIERLTGSPFSVDALVEDASRTPDEAVARQRERFDAIERVPLAGDDVKLNAKIRLVHGAEVIASTEGSSFDDVAGTFKGWIDKAAAATTA